MAAPARRLDPAPRRPDKPPTGRSVPSRAVAGARAALALAPARPRHLGRPDAPARAKEQEATRPQLRIVRPRVRRRRAGVVAAAVCCFTFLVMLGLTVFQARIAAEQMRIEQIDRDIADEQANYTRLRLAVAQAQTPEAAAARARAAGLALPAKGIEAYVTPSLADVIAATATGAQGPTAAAPRTDSTPEGSP